MSIKTIPDIPLKSHIDQLFEILLTHFPDLKREQLRFAAWGRENKPSTLMTEDEFLPVFARIVDEGHSWINLAGDLWHEEYFVVVLEFSKAIGLPASPVLLAGPTLDVDGKPSTMPFFGEQI